MQGDRVDELVHVVEDQPDRPGQLLHGVAELGEELRLAGLPHPGGVQAAARRHRRAGRERGHHRRPQPLRVVVVTVQAHPSGVEPVDGPGAGVGPVREEHRLAVAGRGADQRGIGTARGVEVRPQPRPHHQFRRKLRNSDLRQRNQRHRAQPPVWQVRGRRAEPTRIVVAIVDSGICSILRPRVLSAWVLVAVEDLGDRGERGSFRGVSRGERGRRSEEEPEHLELRRLPAGNDDGRHGCPCSGRVGAGGPAATGTAARSRS